MKTPHALPGIENDTRHTRGKSHPKKGKHHRNHRGRKRPTHSQVSKTMPNTQMSNTPQGQKTSHALPGIENNARHTDEQHSTGAENIPRPPPGIENDTRGWRA